MTAPRHVVGFSGGKDSTAMALRLRELHPHIDFEYVITPTGDELPEMEAHWREMERLLGARLVRANNKTLFECIEEEGMIPNFRARFCTRILKIEPFVDYMLSLPSDSVLYVGLRADEDGRLGLVPPGAQFEVRFPMQDWGWGLADVQNYLSCADVRIPARTDCGACFYQRLHEWKELLDKHPDRYQRYVDVEERVGHTFRSPGRDTWPASLEDLRSEFERGRPLRKSPTQKEKKCRFCNM